MGNQLEKDLDITVEEILEVVVGMLDIPEERVNWSIARAIRALVRDFAMDSTTLIDRMLELAQDTIRCQEGVPATIVGGKLFGARGHEVIASVEVTVDDGERAFTVWVVADLDTEEVYCI